MAKGKKKRTLKIKNIIILLSIIIILIISIYYILTLPIKNIYISGNDIVPDKEIIKISTLGEYPSFLLTRTSTIKKLIKQNSYIKKVSLKKKWGNNIEITIEEYQPIAVLEEKIILSNGNLIDNNYNLLDIPNLINTPNDISTFAAKFSKINSNILRQISEIEYSPTNVDDERYLLYMNDTNLVYITLTKITKLNKYNKIKDKLENKTGIIYLDSGDYVELK